MDKQAAQNQTLRMAGDTHTGLVRQANEDSFAYSIDPGSGKSLVVVADGIGGHESGEIASRLAVKMMLISWRSQSINGDFADNAARRFLSDAMLQSNEAIFGLNEHYAIQHPMGTTVVSGVFMPDCLITAHAGDSRCYQLVDGNLRTLTRDHSFVEELYERKLITREEMRNHPFAHIISRSVGPTADLVPEVNRFPRQPGDRFLFCTDGLTGHIDDETIEGFLANSETPEEVVRDLLYASLKGGGEDNITIVAVFT